MEQKIKIRLNTIETVKRFIKVAESYQSDVDVFTERVTIDGKSIIGLFALDLTQDIYTRIITDDINERRKFAADMEEFK